MSRIDFQGTSVSGLTSKGNALTARPGVDTTYSDSFVSSVRFSGKTPDRAFGTFLPALAALQETTYPPEHIQQVRKVLEYFEDTQRRVTSKDAYLFNTLIQRVVNSTLYQVAQKQSNPSKKKQPQIMVEKSNAMAQALYVALQHLHDQTPNLRIDEVLETAADFCAAYIEAHQDEDDKNATINQTLTQELEMLETVLTDVTWLNNRYHTKDELVFDFDLWNPLVELSKIHGEKSLAIETLYALEAYRDDIWKASLKTLHQEMLTINAETGFYNEAAKLEGLAALNKLAEPEGIPRWALMNLLQDRISGHGYSAGLVESMVDLIFETPDTGVIHTAIQALLVMHTDNVPNINEILLKRGWAAIDQLTQVWPDYQKNLGSHPLTADLFKNELVSPLDYLNVIVDGNMVVTQDLLEAIVTKHPIDAAAKAALALAKEQFTMNGKAPEWDPDIQADIDDFLQANWERRANQQPTDCDRVLGVDVLEATYRLGGYEGKWLPQLQAVAMDEQQLPDDRARAFHYLAQSIWVVGYQPPVVFKQMYNQTIRNLLKTNDVGLFMRIMNDVYLSAHIMALNDKRTRFMQKNPLPIETAMKDYVKVLKPKAEKIRRMLDQHTQTYPLPGPNENRRELPHKAWYGIHTQKLLTALTE